ncbi:MAG TPA: GtrA family protein [Puia sp.]|nr:GtrA family protein [Puia sp.]
MLTYIKAQAASIVGSLADYAMTLFLVEILHCWYLLGNFVGNITGAIMQFILCRNWAFTAAGEPVRPQVVKFILVWVGNLALSAAGVYSLTHFLGLNYIISKTIVSVFLGLTYNYLLQKWFVFS